jgi:hypothetical protein
MKRFYDCVEIVIPKKDSWNDGCPLDKENCYDCEYFKRGGNLGGQVWIDCSYDEKAEENKEQDLEDAPGGC